MSIETDDQGQFLAKIRVAQLDVPPDFRMQVPVSVELADGRVVQLALFVTGRVTETELPAIPVEPTRIRLDPDGSVLAEVREVQWP